ncbi:MAG: alpha/beta hydrolase [Acidimicrobiia bacterium]|nr:alpha/beta hydrolase [Acidimicrobiia bacterium]
MNGTRIPINGVDLYHEVHGTGRPLVVLHGGVLNAETCFGAMIPRLAETHQVIAVDLQGHGRTADTDRPVTLANFAADVVGLLDHLSIDRADVFGFSLGSLVSTEMAVTHPARVGRLVLAAGHIRADGYRPEILDPAQTSPLLPTEEDFEAMRVAYEAVAPDPEHFFPFLEKMQPVVSEFEGWSDAAIGGITGPTLLIVGDHDFVRLEHAALMFELFPDAQLAVLPGTTHMQVIRRTDALLALVEPFLDGRP